jgi:nitrite reductase (NADH) large subunit
MHDLPAIWKDLVDAGMESGHAYGKALRTVKSCVGSTWCRYGQQDSVSMAVALENRYKGVRAPHKFKMGVSGCLRECAEARGKDIGLIATQAGYTLYVCGNGGARPKHATLLASDIDEATAIKYIDRLMMFYTSTAKHLQRTAPWLEELPGGIAYLKKVIIDDSLGICAELEAMVEYNSSQYKCEWKEVVYDEELQKKFKQFVNTDETHDSEQIEYIDMRKQRHPNTYSPPDITGPALFQKEEAPDDWTWVHAGKASEFPKNGGLAMKHGRAEIAVFHMPGRADAAERWLATQNLCPHKQARTISRGLLGEPANGSITLADPIYKTIYDLKTGFGVSHPSLNLSTFCVKVDESGAVLVKLPSPEALESALEKQAQDAYRSAGLEHPALPGLGHPRVKKSPKSLDW